jgi:hypothetical protein
MMARFEVEMGGHLYCKWPSGQEITLLGCRFVSSNGDREFTVRAEVEADTEEATRKAGREQCLDATYLFEFCTSEPVDLDESQDHVRKKGGEITTGTKSIGIGTDLVSNTPLTEEQLAAVAKTESTVQREQNTEGKEMLKRAIHWQALGRREIESQIDRFIKFWIALEILVEGKGKYVVNKVTEELTALYPHCSDKRIRDVLGRIYGVRIAIVHYGIREPENLEQRLNQLKDILGDVLRKRLGLGFKALAERHFGQC